MAEANLPSGIVANGSEVRKVFNFSIKDTRPGKPECRFFPLPEVVLPGPFGCTIATVDTPVRPAEGQELIFQGFIHDCGKQCLLRIEPCAGSLKPKNGTDKFPKVD